MNASPFAFKAADIEVKWTKHGGPNFHKNTADWHHVVIGHLDFRSSQTLTQIEGRDKEYCDRCEQRARLYIWDKMYGPLQQALMEMRTDCVRSAMWPEMDRIAKRWNELLNQLDEARKP